MDILWFKYILMPLSNITHVIMNELTNEYEHCSQFTDIWLLWLRSVGLRLIKDISNIQTYELQWFITSLLQYDGHFSIWRFNGTINSNLSQTRCQTIELKYRYMRWISTCFAQPSPVYSLAPEDSWTMPSCCIAAGASVCRKAAPLFSFIWKFEQNKFIVDNNWKQRMFEDSSILK